MELLHHIINVFISTIADVLPIAGIIFGFQFLVIRKPIPNMRNVIAGFLLVLVGLAFIWLVFPRLLPDRSEKRAFANLREFTLEVAVAPGGPLVGQSVEQAGLRSLDRVYLVEIERNGNIVTAVPSGSTTLKLEWIPPRSIRPGARPAAARWSRAASMSSTIR